MGVSGRNILLLQGPMGPFFWWLARGLKKRGANVYKINFNGGDVLFYPFGGIPFRGSLAAWPSFIESIIRDKHIDEIVLFGDCRSYHNEAIGVACQMGIKIRVFEEGYLRPDWITLEKGGVNGHSILPSDSSFYKNQKILFEEESLEKFSHPFTRMVFFTILYALVGWLCKLKYPKYRHHRGNNVWREARQWLISAWRKCRHAPASKKTTSRAAGYLSGKYFLFPLQVHNDFQLEFHSPNSDQSKVLNEVMESFARHAPKDFFLIIKHHPMDRPYRDYTSCIHKLSQHHNLSDRVIYTWDSHLPTLLRHARGVVTINSTVGLQALFHKIPVKALGKAVYKMEGLTDQGFLKDFWVNPNPPDADLYQKFRSYLLSTNQINGSFSYPPTRQLLDRWAFLLREDISTETAEMVFPWFEVA